MTEFSQHKQLILDTLEHGDRIKIARRVKVSRPTLESALNKCCLDEMTPMEMKAWRGCLRFVREKIKKRNEAISQLEDETIKIADML